VAGTDAIGAFPSNTDGGDRGHRITAHKMMLPVVRV
jgi:hypothetical protein